MRFFYLPRLKLDDFKEEPSLLVFVFFLVVYIDADFIFTDSDGEPTWVSHSSQNKE